MANVIVYDDRSDIRNGLDVWRATSALVTRMAQGSASHDDLLTTLIAVGVYESALADALCPVRDEPHPLLTRVRAISESTGTAVAASIAGDRVATARAAIEAADAWTACAAIDVPVLSVKVPEGYAFYSLYPESYAEAVVAWAGRTRPDRVLAVGLRSIGTSLSAVVTGALRRSGVNADSWTLRPRGHPFDRRLEIAPSLAAMLQPAGSTVLIVDEGPGLSGSSMTATAAAISALGVPDSHIIFVPSWNPDPSTFVSSASAARWRRHHVIVPAFDQIRRMLADEGAVPSDAKEISAGAWRAALSLPPPWPAVHPQHERRKFLCGSELVRFAGLGVYGDATAHRAHVLSEAGWSPAPLRLRRGFLATAVVNGTAMRHSDATSQFVMHAAAYIAWLRGQAPADIAPRGLAALERLQEMLLTNTRQALGSGWLAAADSLVQGASAFSEPATAVDGRLQPHEWVAMPAGGWAKTDGLDHHRDHFLPGCTDAAWDVAGFIVEWGLAGHDTAAFLDEYVTRSRDRSIAVRLPFFTAAYAAFRAGYCAMSAGTLSGTDDARRFEMLAGRYRDALRVTLASAQPAVPSAR
jgi:hypothetical protein